MASNDDWKSPAFRSSMAQKLEAVMQETGTTFNSRTGADMENHIFQKVTTREDYTTMLSKIAMTIKHRAGNAAMGMMSKGPGQIGMTGHQGNMMGGMGMMNPNANPGGQMNLQQQQVHSGPQGQMMGQANFVNQGQLQPGQMQGAGTIQIQQGQPGMHQQQMPGQPMQNLIQVQQGQGQMGQFQTMQMGDQIRPMGNMQQMQPGMTGPQNMGGTPVGSMNMQGQLQSQQIAVGNSQDPQLRGMVQQMHPGQAQQMSGQRMMNPGMNPRMMNSNTMMQNPSQKGPTHMRMTRPSNMDSGQNVGNFVNNTLVNRGPTPSQYVPGPGSQTIGQTPSPGPPMPMYAGSPQQSRMPSPAGGMTHNIRSSYPGHGVPSPQSSLNTPASVAAPSPGSRSAEDQACQDKIKELRRYVDLLQRMIAKAGNEDAEKSSKMKKLLDILTNQGQRVSMDLLLKCESALKNMAKSDMSAMFSTTPQPPVISKDQPSPFQQLMDGLICLSRTPSSSHTLLRTFKPTIEALSGPQFGAPSSVEDELVADAELQQGGVPPVLKREIRSLDSRFKVSIRQPGGGNTLLCCSMNEPRLPRVPPLNLDIRWDYPLQAPELLNFTEDYGTTPFLKTIAKTMKSRLIYLPKNYTVIELLNIWELCIRQAANPSPKPVAKFDTSSPAVMISMGL